MRTAYTTLLLLVPVEPASGSSCRMNFLPFDDLLANIIRRIGTDDSLSVAHARYFFGVSPRGIHS